MRNKITIIIPTHNRHHFLDRLLEFYDYYRNLNLKIVVADSSFKEYSRKNMYDIEYYHNPKAQYLEKMIEILENIDTSYVVMCADDDFIIPYALKKCVEFLDNNMDYSSVQGRFSQFLIENRYISYILHYPHSMSRNININSNNPEERMIKLKSENFPLFYSVHRIDNLKDVYFPLYCDFKTGEPLLEHTLDLITIINGKNKTIPIIYGVREYNQASVAKISHSSKEIIRNPHNNEILEGFLNHVTSHLSKKSGYPLDISRKYVSEALNCYIKFNDEYKFKNKRNVIIYFFRFISRRIYDVIIKNNHRQFFTNPNLNIPYFEDLQRINRLIYRYRKKIRKGIGHPKPILQKLLEGKRRFPTLFWWVNKKRIEKESQRLKAMYNLNLTKIDN